MHDAEYRRSAIYSVTESETARIDAEKENVDTKLVAACICSRNDLVPFDNFVIRRSTLVIINNKWCIFRIRVAYFLQRSTFK